MTQQNIYNLLKKKKVWMTAKEISKILKMSTGSATNSLNRLFKHGEIFKKQMDQRELNRFGFAPFQWKIR